MINMNEKKGQAGLDFLMTYGWALLIIVLIIAALFALGIFDIGSFVGSRTSGFSEIGIAGWTLDETGNFDVMFENHAGKGITITDVNVTYKTEVLSYSTPVQLGNGERSGTITLGTFTSPDNTGTSYTLSVNIAYTDDETVFDYSDSGTLTGTVQ